MKKPKLQVLLQNSMLLIILITTTTSSLMMIVQSDLATERVSLIKLRNSGGGRSLLWNITASPCTWAGVFCDKLNTTVVEIHLPGIGLSGQLPTGLGNLTNLQTLSLRFNALSGSIPGDIRHLTQLKNLYLQGNFFSGEIPAFIFRLSNLVRLNLAENNFSGPISPDFNKLTRLDTLLLENNSLTGVIPDLDVPPLERFNVSFNHLTGPIPSKLSSKPASSFLGNSLCGGPLVPLPCNGTGGGGSGKGHRKLSGGAIVGIVTGCVVGLLTLLMLLICLCTRRRSAKEVNRDVKQAEVGEAHREKALAISGGNGGVNVGGEGSVAQAAGPKSGSAKSLVFFGNKNALREFDLEDLMRASAEVLGSGTFGTTYKATLRGGNAVAVKRLKDVTVGEKEFREKIAAAGNSSRENLVALRAYYFNRDEKLLVYDYLPMGSFSALLHGNRGGGRTPLNWETRVRIANGAAKGIAYLHSQNATTSHGNIKSSNILLTNSFEPRVSDYGLAHLARPTPTPNRIDGYRAPEVTDTRKISQKADVYSFGVFLLELVTGKAPTQSLQNEEGVDLPRWVQSVVKEEWSPEVFDIELLRYQNVEEDMVKLLQLAVDCTAQYPDNRPTMARVSTRIEELCHSSNAEHESSNDIIEDKFSSLQTPSADSGAPPS